MDDSIFDFIIFYYEVIQVDIQTIDKFYKN
jgi:hypothetical protein